MQISAALRWREGRPCLTPVDLDAGSEEDLGETFEDVWNSRTNECTEDQEEADKEVQNEDDQEQERENEMTSKSGSMMGQL